MATVLVCASPMFAAQVTVGWDPSPGSSVTGYKVYCSTNSGEYFMQLDAGNNTIATITNLTEGVRYIFVVTAYTESGVESLPSNELEYQVPVTPPPNSPPVVSAGPNQSLTLPAVATLKGSVADDGLPAVPGTLPGAPDGITTLWSVVSGPGSVAFSDAHALETTAAFSVIGEYVLRFSAFDGEYTSTDQMIVTVDRLPDEPPLISGFSLTEAGPRLAWSSLPGRQYRVVFKESFDEAVQWTDASPDIPATDVVCVWVDTNAPAEGQRFYAVVLLP
ncbi:MAG TPA: fibronectin type III domain-containing protein [Verrucomicrobiota bacterium]|nr:fibronectin type III domain-containing protein [Verrucomicrobiota bacterium]